MTVLVGLGAGVLYMLVDYGIFHLVCPMLANTFGDTKNLITIQRTTGEYHGYMALILFVGYLGVVLWNIRHGKPSQKISLGRLLSIGILVQFGWEAALLIGGIRSAAIAAWGDKLMTLVVNSLLETNLGMPYVYALYLLYSARFTEQLRRRQEKLTFIGALEENNAGR